MLGRVFSSSLKGDYWTVIDSSGALLLMEATYFSGRPKVCKYKDCPFSQCNYKRNQFCYNKNSLISMKEISKILFILKIMKGEVIFADWTHRKRDGFPTLNTVDFRK